MGELWKTHRSLTTRIGEERFRIIPAGEVMEVAGQGLSMGAGLERGIPEPRPSLSGASQGRLAGCGGPDGRSRSALNRPEKRLQRERLDVQSVVTK
jgi:hypothetical protein